MATTSHMHHRIILLLDSNVSTYKFTDSETHFHFAPGSPFLWFFYLHWEMNKELRAHKKSHSKNAFCGTSAILPSQVYPWLIWIPKLHLRWINWPGMCGLTSDLSILLHWPVCLCLCQYHTVLFTVALWYSLKLRNLISPALLFFPKIILNVQGHLCFHTNFSSDVF